MAINRIRFQARMSLAQFLGEHGTVPQCEAALQAATWPDGFVCPHCTGRTATIFRRRNLNFWQCSHCYQRASLTAGTLFEHTQLPLTIWFGAVSLDDACLGGKRRGSTPGRGCANKIPFVAAVEMRNGKPGRVRFDPVTGFTFGALRRWAAHALAPGGVVASAGLIGFSVLEIIGHVYRPQKTIPGKAGCEAEPFACLNTILGNLKTALSGTHHLFRCGKYARRYLAEAQYRLSRRFDMAAMLRRLFVAAVRTTPCLKQVIQTTTDEGT